MADRLQLRDAFESIAGRYHHARPRYPAALFDSLEALSGINSPAKVLEIGCGTGIATAAVADRGHGVTCVELGAELAAQAQANLADYSDVSVESGSFDTWDPPTWGSFDLVFAATAWHWLDPATKYERAHRHLRPGGALAFWSASHVVPTRGDPFFSDLQDIYDEIDESLPGDNVFPKPGELPERTAEIEASGLFGAVAVQHFDWETVYDASDYIALLQTFSGHITMENWKRDRLYGEIGRRLSERSDGLVRRHWGAVLHVAPRLP